MLPCARELWRRARCPPPRPVPEGTVGTYSIPPRPGRHQLCRMKTAVPTADERLGAAHGPLLPLRLQGRRKYGLGVASCWSHRVPRCRTLPRGYIVRPGTAYLVHAAPCFWRWLKRLHQFPVRLRSRACNGGVWSKQPAQFGRRSIGRRGDVSQPLLASKRGPWRAAAHGALQPMPPAREVSFSRQQFELRQAIFGLTTF